MRRGLSLKIFYVEEYGAKGNGIALDSIAIQRAVDAAAAAGGDSVEEHIKIYHGFSLPSYHCLGNHDSDRTTYEKNGCTLRNAKQLLFL